MKRILDGRNALAHHPSETTLDLCTQVYSDIRALMEKLEFSESLFILSPLDSDCLNDGRVEVSITGVDRSSEKVRLPIDTVKLHGRDDEKKSILDFLSGRRREQMSPRNEHASFRVSFCSPCTHLVFFYPASHYVLTCHSLCIYLPLTMNSFLILSQALAMGTPLWKFQGLLGRVKPLLLSAWQRLFSTDIHDSTSCRVAQWKPLVWICLVSNLHFHLWIILPRVQLGLCLLMM